MKADARTVTSLPLRHSGPGPAAQKSGMAADDRGVSAVRGA